MSRSQRDREVSHITADPLWAPYDGGDV